jgi:hypothetical protein
LGISGLLDQWEHLDVQRDHTGIVPNRAQGGRRTASVLASGEASAIEVHVETVVWMRKGKMSEQRGHCGAGYGAFSPMACLALAHRINRVLTTSNMPTCEDEANG